MESERRSRLVILIKEERALRDEAKRRKDEKFRIMLEKQNKKKLKGKSIQMAYNNKAV